MQIRTSYYLLQLLSKYHDQPEQLGVSAGYLSYWKESYGNHTLHSYEDYELSLSIHERMIFDNTIIQNKSYIDNPPHVELARRFVFWSKQRTVPSFVSSVSGYKEKECDCDYISTLNPKALEILDAMKEDSDNTEYLLSLFHLLGDHGIQHVLGMRHTIGSIDRLYPPKSYLLSLFDSLHKPPATLTVGARALSKHCIRCKSTWGELKGSEFVQNDKAKSTVMRILQHCVWMNIHRLPHEVIVIELRNEDGFGARWDLTHQQFRGFVEPYMENGYIVGWNHNE